MITFSTDPKVAEQQMRAVIFYLTAFGYVDGELDSAEKRYVRDYAGKLVVQRARAAMGDELDAHYETIERWIEHFHEVIDETDHQIKDLFTESVADGESTAQFVVAKLKLRCFELFRYFDSATRSELLATVDELMFADGNVHPNEETFRRELYRLLFEPIEIAEAELEAIEERSLVITAATTLTAREPDHPFFQGSERRYATDREAFARDAQGDMDLIARVLTTLETKRLEGKDRLVGARDITSLPFGASFLDGHVFVERPAPETRQELLVVGDLHGCYSCLKAALLQADFFRKVEAYKADPKGQPRMGVVLLGDYIDRGRFSYNGVLRAVLQLFAALPEHVYLLRGNHEYYVEINGKVMAPVRPCEAMNEIAHLAPKEVFATYMRLFEALPTSLLFDQTLFVHAGIPREDTLKERWKGLESLNDPEIRFQMLWSDPSEADTVPLELQSANARFPFGKKQFQSFMAKLGMRTLIRGHEKVNEGFRAVYDDPEGTLLTVFSAGGATNEDLPPGASYREVTPMALTIQYEGGTSSLTPFAIDYARFNDPKVNAFFRDQIAAPAP